MKLYNFMNDITNVHKLAVKRNLNPDKVFSNDKFTITFTVNNIIVQRNNLQIPADSAFILNCINNPTTHPNNIGVSDKNTPTEGHISFFRMSSGDDVLINYAESIKIPKYNDNEEEIRFSLSTVTSADLEITLMSILFTLNTHMTTMYTNSLKEEEIDIIMAMVTEAKKWIIENTQTS